jgi:hypothetical protein
LAQPAFVVDVIRCCEQTNIAIDHAENERAERKAKRDREVAEQKARQGR